MDHWSLVYEILCDDRLQTFLQVTYEILFITKQLQKLNVDRMCT